MDKKHFKNYSDLINDIADDIKPIIRCLDLILEKYKLSDIDSIIANMDRNNSSLQALPFPETMRKAELFISQTETFRKLRDLLVARLRQIDITLQDNRTPGQQVLEDLGF